MKRLEWPVSRWSGHSARSQARRWNLHCRRSRIGDASQHEEALQRPQPSESYSRSRPKPAAGTFLPQWPMHSVSGRSQISSMNGAFGWNGHCRATAGKTERSQLGECFNVHRHGRAGMATFSFGMDTDRSAAPGCTSVTVRGAIARTRPLPDPVFWSGITVE